MTQHTEPNGWKFVHKTFFQTRPDLLAQMKNNPDVQYSVEHHVYWVRPESATHTLLILANAFPTIPPYTGGGPSVLGIPRNQLR